MGQDKGEERRGEEGNLNAASSRRLRMGRTVERTRHHTMQLPSVDADMHCVLSLLIFRAFTDPLCSERDDTRAWRTGK